jgi:hypothetical protein
MADDDNPHNCRFRFAIDPLLPPGGQLMEPVTYQLLAEQPDKMECWMKRLRSDKTLEKT